MKKAQSAYPNSIYFTISSDPLIKTSFLLVKHSISINHYMAMRNIQPLLNRHSDFNLLNVVFSRNLRMAI